MVTKRKIRALKKKLQTDDEHTEIKIYWQQEDGSVAEKINGTGKTYSPKEWQEFKREAIANGDLVIETDWDLE